MIRDYSGAKTLHGLVADAERKPCGFCSVPGWNPYTTASSSCVECQGSGYQMPRGNVYNADTGERIPLVYRFDNETGEYWHYVADAAGHAQLDPSNPNEVLRGSGRCRLKFVPFDADGKADFVRESAEPMPAKIKWREWL